MNTDCWQSFCDSLLMEDDKAMEGLRASMEERDIPIIRRETEYFLKWLLASKAPKRILEIGTAAGYSGMYMLRHAQSDATLVTIEQDARIIPEARANFSDMSLGSRVSLLEGDAARVIEDLDEGYDLIFLDSSKAQYITMLCRLKGLLNEGGILVSDNILFDGDILLPRYAVRRRDRTIHKRMREYLYAITHDDELVTDIMPIGDGIAVSTKHEKT